MESYICPQDPIFPRVYVPVWSYVLMVSYSWSSMFLRPYVLKVLCLQGPVLCPYGPMLSRSFAPMDSLLPRSYILKLLCCECLVFSSTCPPGVQRVQVLMFLRSYILKNLCCQCPVFQFHVPWFLYPRGHIILRSFALKTYAPPVLCSTGSYCMCPGPNVPKVLNS